MAVNLNLCRERAGQTGVSDAEQGCSLYTARRNMRVCTDLPALLSSFHAQPREFRIRITDPDFKAVGAQVREGGSMWCCDCTGALMTGFSQHLS
jgi:hypothetical protein